MSWVGYDACADLLEPRVYGDDTTQALTGVHKQDFFTNARGVKLFWQSWVPDKPKALLFFIHGFGEHSSFAAINLVPWAAKCNFALVGLDLESHGLSGGSVRTYISKFDYFVDDAEKLIKTVVPMFPNLKYFIYGQSMGGAIALLLSKRPLPEGFGGLILCAPMVKISEESKPPSFMIPVLKGLAFLLPTVPMVGSVSIDKIYRDPDVRQKVMDDPLSNHDKIKLWMGWECLKACERISATMEDITSPFLVVHGGYDQTTDLSASKELQERAQSQDKTLKVYDGLWHALLWEPEDLRQPVLDDMKTW
eukprot:CAMPEP_0184672070 /NCGR_PEP_ID=MMETSP0308-20130426/85880_1 /TAXON_ID=38269 /ORGANISM="Gloeochaete witrockiana, Strain SAG 46.84" /LENGTH=306 /DNA_ID=CAMNT_0027119325 /DNA_START=562 /DNA_END=1479 /DNA_ORIENTATION=-